MVQIAIHGAAGRMGRSIAAVLNDDLEGNLVAAMDREDSELLGQDMGVLTGREPSGVRITCDLEEFLSNVEVVIDFSGAAATAKLLPVCAGQRIPMVIGTTGLDAATRAGLERAAEMVPIVFAPNYSQGVNALYFLAARATELLGPAFDAEIVEMHHRFKVDAPSGTAVRLAEVVAEAKQLDPERAVNPGRSGQVGARPLEEIGVMALRGGDVVGEHTLYLVGEGERLELTHRATDRSIFARGAVRAAHWVVARPAGLYDMADVMGIPR
ncbi:MAG TPA: 4-hydroxy-tetrahydrodipicolinate reductase [Polyangiales bacterium]|nr:4-hydroxy-tetrahydrodipicolinate reductase [Polyangiales bacterium]